MRYDDKTINKWLCSIMIDILHASSEYRKNRKVDNKNGFVFVVFVNDCE